MNMIRETFVCYKSVKDSFDSLYGSDKSLAADFAKAVFDYGCCGDYDRTNPIVCALMSSVEVQIDRAAARYQEAQSVGKCGGRPRLEIDRDKAYRLYGELKNWEKVAKVMGVSARTLKDRRVMWELEGK